MSDLVKIILATLIISLISFSGVIIFVFKESILEKILLVLVSLSAGVMLASALLDLLPASIMKLGGSETKLFVIFLVVILGFVVFFIFEQFITWHHCHKTPHNHSIKPVSYMILFGDGLHNLLDGVAIAAAFLTNPSLGITTTAAITFHEIPQEMGDYGVLVFSGFSKYKAVLANFVSALTAIIGGILGYYLHNILADKLIWVLPFLAGSFIYIAATDLIPEIKHHQVDNVSFIHFLFFILGLVIITAITALTH